MTIKPIVVLGTERLSQPSLPVEKFGTPELFDLIENMRDTMYEKNGVGIAAPQIGVYLRVIMIGFKENPRYPGEASIPLTVLINPELELLTTDTASIWEGCLSIPGLRGLVPRVTKLKYKAFDIDGNPFSGIAENFHARVLQHEVDHINGELYPDRLPDFKNFGYEEVIWERAYGVPKPTTA
jgi:peptide deformylase